MPAALEAVCGKAMALRPADRYATALDLAADVEHWLADEPVAAYREPWTARVARWGRRHRTAVVAAGVFLMSAVVALAVSTMLVWREEQKTAQQKRIADENYLLARDLSFTSLDLIDSLQGRRKVAAAAAKVGRTTSRAFHRYLEQQSDDRTLRSQTAQIDRYTGNLHRRTNEFETAEPFYLDSIKLQEELVEQFPDEMVHRQNLAEALRDYAQLQAAQGNLRQATDTLHRSITISETLRGDVPDRPQLTRPLAISLLDLSGIEYGRGRIAESGKTAGARRACSPRCSIQARRRAGLMTPFCLRRHEIELPSRTGTRTGSKPRGSPTPAPSSC